MTLNIIIAKLPLSDDIQWCIQKYIELAGIFLCGRCKKYNILYRYKYKGKTGMCLDHLKDYKYPDFRIDHTLRIVYSGMLLTKSKSITLHS